MPSIPTEKSHCNTCGGSKNHLVVNRIEQPWSDDLPNGYPLYGARNYTIYQCAGCDEVTMKMETWHSEHTDVDNTPIIERQFFPPRIYRAKPDWLWIIDPDWHISKLSNEVYAAIQNGSYALASMGLRALIEAIMIDKVGDSGSFQKNLTAFEQNGFVSKLQVAALSSALELGHASIHRGHVPNAHQVGSAMDIVDNLINQLYVIPYSAEHLSKEVPKRAS